jgi:hypothetical protein
MVIARGLGNTWWSQMDWAIWVRTTFPIGSSSRHYWETFTSTSVFSSYLSWTGTIRGFEDVVASSAMIAFLLMSLKNKIVAKTTNLVLIFEWGLMFYLEIMVGIVCDHVGFDRKTIWKPQHFRSNGFIKP